MDKEELIFIYMKYRFTAPYARFKSSLEPRNKKEKKRDRKLCKHALCLRKCEKVIAGTKATIAH